MGLDMYLYLSKYESCGSWTPNYESRKVDFYPQELAEFGKEIDERNFMSKETLYRVGYWRKSNAIHKWFVDLADGEDKCQKIYVSLERIKDLRNIVNRVLNTPELAKDLLPVCEGFLFGSTDYDEWYFEDLKYTKDLLDRVIVLAEKYDYDIVYQASW